VHVFVAMLVTWMSFASGVKELRGGALIMPETHIVISFLIFCLVLSLTLCLALLLMPCLGSLMDLTIAHMVLVHKRTALGLDVLVMAHVLIVVIVSHVCLFFLLEGFTLTLSPRHLDSPHFPHCGSYPTQSSDIVQRVVKIASGRMVKCWIPKIYLTNPSTEPSIFSRPL
jgi:hypothetical protein